MWQEAQRSLSGPLLIRSGVDRAVPPSQVTFHASASLTTAAAFEMVARAGHCANPYQGQVSREAIDAAHLRVVLVYPHQLEERHAELGATTAAADGYAVGLSSEAGSIPSEEDRLHLHWWSSFVFVGTELHRLTRSVRSQLTSPGYETTPGQTGGRSVSCLSGAIASFRW